jgi:hypothetical protein
VASPPWSNSSGSWTPTRTGDDRPWINGHDLDAPEDGAFNLVIAVADGSLADVEKIAERLAGWSRPR